MKKVALVGNPNVGKSVIFHKLTGHYVDVSNYPGTTVKVARGESHFYDGIFQIIDTPGTYTLGGGTAEERTTRRILLNEDLDLIVLVLDAKNLDRMLPFTLLVLESGHKVIVNLNLMDEARKTGLDIDIPTLEHILKVPVVPTVATKGEGIGNLKREIVETIRHPQSPHLPTDYGEPIENTITQLTNLIHGNYNVSQRFLALLMLQGASEAQELLKENEQNYPHLLHLVDSLRTLFSRPLFYVLQERLQVTVNDVINRVVSMHEEEETKNVGQTLSRYMMQPLTGIPILFGILLVMYEFVGVFGAQFLVDTIEVKIFEHHINPWINDALTVLIPNLTFQDVNFAYWIQELIGGEYGIVTLGFQYALAIILPIVTTFFLFFSILEDSGYLSRLAMLTDRIFKKMGLNGRAIIPLVLGTGCDTMATMVTRTLDTKREKIISILLLSLGIPCSAQLGVILAIAPNYFALLFWFAFVVFLLFLTGYLASKLMPGQKPIFIEEIPPLRVPQVRNVLRKTWARLKWYFMEILPLFLLVSVFIWIGRLTGTFKLFVGLMDHPVKWMGLPKETAEVFLFGFFRRDYGAAGLYDLKMAGLLTNIHLIVSMVTITLFVPCIGQLLMTIREQGVKTAVIIELLVFSIAFGTGYLLNGFLTFLGV